MSDYLVTWEIEISGDSPEDAAQRALEIMRDRDSMATVFRVWDEHGIDTAVDLCDQDADEMRAALNNLAGLAGIKGLSDTPEYRHARAVLNSAGSK